MDVAADLDNEARAEARVEHVERFVEAVALGELADLVYAGELRSAGMRPPPPAVSPIYWLAGLGLAPGGAHC